MSIQEWERLARERRSVFPKDFTGEPIPDAIVEKMLENCLWAPTHGRTEPWRFKIFTGEALHDLGRLLASVYKDITPEASFKASKHDALAVKPAMASHVIGIWMKRQESTVLPIWDEVMAVACAVQNLYLSVAAYGLGGYWSTGALAYSDTLKAEMGLGANDMFLGFFYLGVPKTGLPQNRERAPLMEKCEWIRSI